MHDKRYEIHLSPEANWLLFHTFNNHKIVEAMKEGMKRMEECNRPLFGHNSLYQEIINALINMNEIPHDPQ